MSTLSQSQPYNLQTGVVTSLVPSPFGSPQLIAAVAIYNSTPVPVLVTNGSGGEILWPGVAQVFEYPSIALPPTVTPLTSINVASNTPQFVGTVSAVFYDDANNVPPGYPLPIGVFSGGQATLVSGFGFETFSPTYVGVATFVVPPGATQLSIASNSTFSGTGRAQIVGVSTGNVYATASGWGGGGPFSITATFPAYALDTEFSLNVESLGGGAGFPSIEAVASIGLSLPQFATNGSWLSFSTLPQTLLPAFVPFSGAWYLFGAELGVGTSSAVDIGLQDGATGAILASWLFTAQAAGTDYVQGPPIDTERIRFVGALNVVNLAGTLAGGAFISWRWASGP